MRSVIKALSWRVVATLATMLLVYVFTGEVALSVAIGGLEFLVKLLLYWMHERVWDRLRFGKTSLGATESPGAAVLWLTGLSGSGKSTLSEWVTRELRARGVRVEQLDGDAIRDILPNTGFSKTDRDAHIRRVGYLASKLEQNGVFVVASFVSPYAEPRNFVRGLCRRFLEVHVATPLGECERRDVKGLYAKARLGEIRNFTGIDDPYEPPMSPELSVDTSGLSVPEAGRLVMEMVERHLALEPQSVPVAAGRPAPAGSR